MSPRENEEMNPHLSFLALICFIISFLVARVFTTLSPNTVLVGDGIHIHHFWYGLAMIVIGGWLGISYRSVRITRLAAILFGIGGGLVGDEVGLLLTFGDYYSGITYTFVILFVTFAATAILVYNYSQVIRRELSGLLKVHGILYVGVFLAGIAVAFIAETDNIGIAAVSSIITITGCIAVLIYLVRRARSRHSGKD